MLVQHSVTHFTRHIHIVRGTQEEEVYTSTIHSKILNEQEILCMYSLKDTLFMQILLDTMYGY